MSHNRLLSPRLSTLTFSSAVSFRGQEAIKKQEITIVGLLDSQPLENEVLNDGNFVTNIARIKTSHAHCSNLWEKQSRLYIETLLFRRRERTEAEFPL